MTLSREGLCLGTDVKCLYKLSPRLLRLHIEPLGRHLLPKYAEHIPLP